MIGNDRYTYDAIDKLIDDLARPLFNLRRARAILRGDFDNPNLVKSSTTKARNAKIEIRKAVQNYVIGERRETGS